MNEFSPSLVQWPKLLVALRVTPVWLEFRLQMAALFGFELDV